MVYLDNAATSWPKPEAVYQIVEKTLRLGGNAGRGVNSSSLSASRVLHNARYSLAELFNISQPEQIVFTQNVTEAINLALKGLLKPGDHVIISAVEHNAVVRPLEYLIQYGVTYSTVPCDSEGRLLLASLEEQIKGYPRTKIVCISHASNVLGTTQPIKEIGHIVRKYGLCFLVDAAQSAGVLPIDVVDMNIDLLAFTGHKGLLGPQGSGGLYVRPGLALTPLIHGGTGNHSALLMQPTIMPEGLESGTRNIPAIAGLAAGANFCLKNMEIIRTHEINLLDRLLDYFNSQRKIKYYGPRNSKERVGLVSFNIEGTVPDDLGTMLDSKYGIITRTGLHCSPLAHQVMGTMKTGAIRVSVGAFTTEGDVNFFIQAISELAGG